jgi:ribonuclease HI
MPYNWQLKKTVNTYTDSRYAFTTLHVHGAIYQERGLITLEGKDIKYGSEILELLEAVWAPKKVTVMYCPGHQKDKIWVAK